MNSRPIIVTRAGDAGRLLAGALAEAGEDVLWLPAFEFGPAPDEARVRTQLGNLSRYDLAIFVSPAAAQAVAARLAQPWPAPTTIGAVGEGTRRAILVRIAGAAEATLVAPRETDAEEGGGSEALWSTLQPIVKTTRRALILRAEQGREWLAERLADAGVEVETLAVYTRKPAIAPPEAVARLRGWRTAGKTGVLLIASSEAVEVVLGLLDPIVDPAWTRAALAIATHERIAERLRGAGFSAVKIATLDVEAIRKAAFAQ